MLTSAEMRWFERGRLPEATSQWFQQDELGDYLAPPEEREDVYLYVSIWGLNFGRGGWKLNGAKHN